jgi:hypothetical protein
MLGRIADLTTSRAVGSAESERKKPLTSRACTCDSCCFSDSLRFLSCPCCACPLGQLRRLAPGGVVDTAALLAAFNATLAAALDALSRQLVGV